MTALRCAAGFLVLATCWACSKTGDGDDDSGAGVNGGMAGSAGSAATSGAGAGAGAGTAGVAGGAAGSAGASGSSAGNGASGTQATAGTSAGAGGSAGTMPDGGTLLGATLRFFNVYNDEPDPRFTSLPASLSSVELLPRVTLEALPPAGVMSVTFQVGALTYVDTAAPFRLSEDSSGAATAWDAQPGSHAISVTLHASSDGSGTPLGEVSTTLEITSAGTDGTPDSGEHTQHKLWVDGDAYSTTAGEFAFMLLLPEGYDATVQYPLLVHLHHGDSAFRGTDNNGLSLSAEPLFNGSRAIHKTSTRIDHPAVVMIPQLIAQETIDDVTHEWAAFHSLSNETGDYEPADAPSRSARHVFDVIADLAASSLMVDGQVVRIDPGRIYVEGHSMGGFGTWDFLVRYPHLFAAGVPMAGYQDHDNAAALVDMPIWAFHHEIDSYNPFHSDTMQARIEAAGGTRMKLTKLTFDTGGQGDQAHFQTPNAAWNDEPDLFVWLFSQARSRM